MSIDNIFGPRDARRCLVVAGACGNVGFGKLGQFGRLLGKHGVPVVGLDVADAVAEVPDRLRKQFGRKFDEAAVEAIVAGISCVQGGPDAVETPIGMVFEAIPERLDWKRAFYTAARAAAPEALLFSATSGFTTSKLFEGLDGAERCGVLHPFFPHLTNKLFELPTDGVTGAETVAQIRGLFAALGLVPLDVRDVPAFAADRVFCMMMTEAVRLHTIDGLPPAVIDAALFDLLGCRPFLVHNVITGANQLSVSCIDELAGESDSSFYAVPPLWREYAEDRDRKWPLDAADGPTPEQHELVRRRVFGALLAIGSRILDQSICSARDLNYMGEEALAMRKGVPALIARLGAAASSELLTTYLAEREVTLPTEVAAPAALTDTDRFANLYLDVVLEGDVLVIGLARPSINHVLIAELDAALDQLAAGPASAAVLIADGAYSQEFGRGADVTEFLPALGDEAAARDLSAGWKRVVMRVREIGKPVVAALSRRSLGGSNELAALCHARIATPGTQIGQPEPVVGVIPGLGGTTTLLRGVPAGSRSRVAELLLTGDAIDAGEAQALGFVSEIVAPAELRARAVALAAALAADSTALPAFEDGPFEVAVPEDAPLTGAAGIPLDPEHRALMIETIRGCAARSFPEAMAWESEQSGRAFLLSAARIGTAALLSGRPPRFGGA